jgi:opacity protein-like surface antigen
MKLLSMIAVGAGIALATPVQAQLFYVGVRGGAAVPKGAFENEQFASQEQFLAGAKQSFGYGADAGINLGPLGFYAGYDKIDFDCAPGSCGSEDSKYKLEGVSAGVRLSVPLFPVIKPWLKGGITLAELESDFGPTSSRANFKTERTPGYEVGAGIDIPFGGIFSLTPQVRYVRQKLDLEIGSGNKLTNDADYYTFDLGLRLRSPL